MKASKIFSFIIVIALTFSARTVWAQLPGPPPGGGGGGGSSAPIDGGASLFLLAAAMYGRKRLQKKELIETAE